MNTHARLLAMAGISAAMMEGNESLFASLDDDKPFRPRGYSGTKKVELTPKQKKRRAASKAARKQRRKNR